eukprot:TRINITY_DN74697_c0_g1_i1.p1 TRINITY_DN74697_c0_g1~~TRINITY_DN74697_c0_g1_i1.p1  ORF type:complete len:547 (-),score=85.82 TRINITY_DN74697_c0_g1_i1:319-1725(-)
MAQSICVGASLEDNTGEGVDQGVDGECVGGGTMIAVDTEFPGFARDMPRQGSREAQYKALRDSVDVLQPIQVGMAVVVNGCVVGAWNFNMRFDLAKDLHTQEAVVFLNAAGVDFQRHATEGVDAEVFGRSLVYSPFIRFSDDAGGETVTTCAPGEPPQWVTFAGFYDLGYLVKLLTNDRLPRDACGFDAALAKLCPRRCELADYLPSGSFQSMLDMYSVERCSTAETRGSDALAMLELCCRAVLGVMPKFAPSAIVGFQHTAPSSGEDSERSIPAVVPITALSSSPPGNASSTQLTADVLAERDKHAGHIGPVDLWSVSARACMGTASGKTQAGKQCVSDSAHDSATQHLAAESRRATLRRTVGKRRGRETLLSPNEPSAGVAMWAAKARERARVAASVGSADSSDGGRGRSGKVQHDGCVEPVIEKQAQASFREHFGGGKSNVAAAAFRPPPGLSLSHFAPAAAVAA